MVSNRVKGETHNNALGCLVVCYLPAKDSIAINLADMVAVGGHQTGNDTVADAAGDGTGKKQETAGDLVDLGKDETSRDEEDNVLDDGRGERLVSQAGHFENIDNVWKTG